MSYDIKNDAKSKQAIAYMWITQARMAINGLPTKPVWRGVKSDFAAHLNKIDINFDNTKTILEAFIKKPADWRGKINIADSKGLALEFGWFSSAVNLGSNLAPARTLSGAGLVRPELPGVGIMEMQGDTDQRGRPDDFPEKGSLSDKMDALEAMESVFVPVLVTAISVQIPYNGAQFATNLRREIGFWVKSA